MRLWRRPARRRSWKGQSTLIRLKDPENPGEILAYHEVEVTPQESKGVPQVHLWVQSGGMAGTVFLAEDEARALAKALIEGIEESKSALAADEPDLP